MRSNERPEPRYPPPLLVDKDETGGQESGVQREGETHGDQTHEAAVIDEDGDGEIA